MLQLAMITIGALSCVRMRPIGFPDCTISVSSSLIVRSVSTMRVMRRPVARGLAERGVHDQIGGVFADGEHVLEQPQQPFLSPAAAPQVRAGSNGKAPGHRRSLERVFGDRDAERLFADRIDRRVPDRRTQRQMRLGDMEDRHFIALSQLPDADGTSIGVEGRDHVRKRGEARPRRPRWPCIRS